MKNFLSFMSLLAVSATSAFAGDVVYHSTGDKYPGTPFEYLNISNALVSGQKTTTGGTGYGISPTYPWIVYNYSVSTLESGTAEVIRSNCYSSLNPIFTNSECTTMIDDGKQWMGSPKIELGFTKSTTNTSYLAKLNPKTITFNVKDATRVDLLLTGAGSNTNDAEIKVAKADGTLVKTIYVEAMAGKSNKPNGSASNSQFVKVDGLDASESYQITVAPSIKNAQLQVPITTVDSRGKESTTNGYKSATEVLGENADFFSDIDLTDEMAVSNVKTPSVAVCAIHIFGSDLTVTSQKPAMAASTTYFSPSGNKTAGLPFAFVNMGNTLQNDAVNTTFDANGDATHGTKYAINDSYPWITYSYSASILNSGKSEVARGGYYSKYNPATEAEEVTYITDYDGLWLGSPKVEMGYTKSTTNTSYLNKLCPKTLTYNIKEATKVKFLLTGAGSNTNDAEIKVAKADGTLVKTIYVDAMAGKSNKSDGSASNSQFVTVDGLDVAESYQITIAPSIKNAQLQVPIETVDSRGNKSTTNGYKAATEVLGENADFFSDIDLTDDMAVSNIKNPNIAVLAVQVYDADETSDKTIEGLVASSIAASKNTLDLCPYVDYTLNAEAPVDQTEFTINGNGADIVAGAKGQITTKKSLSIDKVVLDATATETDATTNTTSRVVPIAMASKASIVTADTTALATWTPAINEVLYTAETAAAQNTANLVNDKNNVAPGSEGYITTYKEGYTEVKEGDVQTAAVAETMKYDNATDKCYEAQLLSVTNSTIKTATSFVSGNDAPWALRKLNVDNCNVETTVGTGKAFIDWEEGATQIKDIVIKNSTLYSDVEASEQRFLRYTNQRDPWRVWGYTDESLKNEAGLNTWDLENNTIVNLCGAKDFANNIKNTPATSLTFKANIFANTWRLQKIGTNCTLNFENTDNVICGITNSVDGTDASKYALEDVSMNISASNFKPFASSLAAKYQYGDPDNLVKYVAPVITPADASSLLASELTDVKVTFTAAKKIAIGDKTDTFTPVVYIYNKATGNDTYSLLMSLDLNASYIQEDGQSIMMAIPAAAASMIVAGDYKVEMPARSLNLYETADDGAKAIPSPAVSAVFTINAASADGVAEVSNAETVKSGKFIENGKVVIYVNNVKYNVNGTIVK